MSTQWPAVLFHTYSSALGNFDFSENDPFLFHDRIKYWFSTFILLFFTVIVVIIMMNLLITILMNHYEEVQEKAKVSGWRVYCYQLGTTSYYFLLLLASPARV